MDATTSHFTDDVNGDINNISSLFTFPTLQNLREHYPTQHLPISTIEFNKYRYLVNNTTIILMMFIRG